MFNVLIVDDEELTRKTLRILVDWESLNMKIIGTCINGKEALDFIHQNHVDIILTDMIMPVMGGLDLICALKREKHPAKIIVLSGYSDFELVSTAYKNGSFEYLLKPEITQENLTDVLTRIKDNILSDIIKEAAWKDYIWNQRNLSQKSRSYFKQIGFDKQRHYICLMVMRIKNYEDFLKNEWDNDNSTLKYAVLNVLDELLQKKSFCDVFSNMPYEFIVIFFFDSNYKLSIMEKIISETKDDITVNFRKCFGASLSIRTSQLVTDVSELKRLYDDALSNLHGTNSAIIEKAKKLMCEKYKDDLTLSYVANRLGVSANYLSALFKKEVGDSFVSYLSKIRINESVRLFETTDMKIYEISEAVGYKNVEHFSRSFKKIMGQSPKRYNFNGL